MQRELKLQAHMKQVRAPQFLTEAEIACWQKVATDIQECSVAQVTKADIGHVCGVGLASNVQCQPHVAVTAAAVALLSCLLETDIKRNMLLSPPLSWHAFLECAMTIPCEPPRPFAVNCMIVSSTEERRLARSRAVCLVLCPCDASIICLLLASTCMPWCQVFMQQRWLAGKTALCT